MRVLVCENCGQVSETDSELALCEPCDRNKWKQETETLKLFEPARAELSGQQGFRLDD